MTQWTQEQLRAIGLRGKSILLSAAAGSGKTTVLVERVMRLVAEEGADLDRMLVVTFTRAAASDMKSKLSRRLSARAASGDARCREQLFRLDRASITTIHAFCAAFLRANFESAGVDPAFRILDETLVERLRAEALDEALEEAYAGARAADDDADAPAAYAPDEGLSQLDYGRGPSGVRAAAEALMRRMEERPDPEAWLERAGRCDDESLARWQDELKDAARNSVDTALVQLEQALRVPGCPAHYEAAIRLDVEALTQLRGEVDYDALYRGIREFKPAPATGGRRSSGDEAAVESVRRLRDAARRAVRGAAIAGLPLTTAREDARRLSGQIRRLSQIALRAAELFEAKKAAQSGLTYGDLEHRTLRALRDPAAAREIRSQYDYVFVDEYQDTSDLQEALIRAVSRPDNLFMVGDVKQSIYRFRMAEPRLFLGKYAAYRDGQGGALLPLTRNFRSRPGILDFVNLVFERAMTGGDAEIVYDELARLNPGDPDAPRGDAPDVELCLIDQAAPGEAGDADRAGDAAEEAIAELKGAEREALLIARRIRAMMAEDPSLSYRDFAILTRSRTSSFSAIMPILLSAGIPAYADGAAGYFDSVEIAWTLGVLRLVANRRSDVELIGVLRSPAVGLDAQALAEIRLADPKSPYCDAALAYARERDDATAARLREFFALYDSWRLRAGSVALGELVRAILDESGFYAYAGALPGGAQRQANLDQFAISAASFDREVSGSLTRFIRYTEHLRARGDGDAAHLLGESDDVVRLMTVHKSKGLEFKVVFGAQLARKYRVDNAGTALLAHRDLGVGMSYIDPELRAKRLSLPQAAIIERGRREDAAEELRILYVLMTRAQRRLVLVGTVRDAEREWKRWEALSAAPFAAASHLDVIMAARCGAERDGLPLHSALTVVPAASLRPFDAEESSDRAAPALLRAVMEDPEAHADAGTDARLAWEYPDPLSAKRPMKLTASGLLRELEGPEVVPALAERPEFMSEDARGMTGAERGTAYHRAMQLIDLRALDGLDGAPLADAAAAQLDAAAGRRLMSAAQREAVDPAVLARFLSGGTGLALRAAAAVRREWPFNVTLDAADALTPEEAARYGGAKLLVQGTIDCCFLEDGAWVLLDYKTDRTRDMDALRAHYARQLGLYALALERITGLPVKRRVLCLIGQGSELEL